MNCKKCKSIMIELNRETILDEMDENFTEGQIAEYFAAQESGEYNEFGYTEITYKCEKCGEIISLVES